MSRPRAALTRLELPSGDGLAEALRGVPSSPGVAQLLGEGGRSLLIARPANLRRWARAQLGLGAPRRGRPATDLSGVARALLWGETRTAFEQRLRCERMLAAHVPDAERRDLPTPHWLHLDPEARFPRLAVSARPPPAGPAWGIFRGRDAARAARDRLNRRFALRPCEEDFEPAADLPLGLGCLYAQVRSCSAPCLERIGPAAYRDLAHRAAEFLSRPADRPAEVGEWLPEAVAEHTARAVVAERDGDDVTAWPVCCGRVGEPATASSPAEAVEGLRWPGAGDGPRDAAWLVDWIGERRRRGVYAVAGEGLEATAASVQRAFEARGNVDAGRSR